MYAAKRSLAERAVYSAEPVRLSPQRLSLVGELRQGILDNQLRLYYQPKVDLRTMQLNGAEALVRWQHPSKGLIPPAEFIPLAERTGLIRPLGLWVLEAALQQCHAWHRREQPLHVAVNLAAGNLDEDLVGAMARLLKQVTAPPGWLTVEVTERAMMLDPARARDVLDGVHELGVMIAIDNFGTGYSSLTHMTELPVDEVKVDQRFVNNMAVSKKDGCIVRSLIDLGHSLGLRVVAEGVENQASLDLLASWGCDGAQGYYFSRPLRAPDFLTWRPTSPESRGDIGTFRARSFSADAMPEIANPC
jgi:EAL domain-containing protein (putative c-di-GMP-specific phosphodiesterase class I)